MDELIDNYHQNSRNFVSICWTERVTEIIYSKSAQAQPDYTRIKWMKILHIRLRQSVKIVLRPFILKAK